ncbi:MAG: hypothetical protein ACK4L4_15465 [Gemmobacter sp.]
MRLILMARPRANSLAEAARTGRARAESGNRHLAVNWPMPDDARGDTPAAALIARDHAALCAMDAHLATLPQSRFPLRPENQVCLVPSAGRTRRS